MEVEQLDIDENIESNDLSHPINAKSKGNKKSKLNINFKKLSIFSIFLITIFAFVILYNFNPQINHHEFTLEKNEKSENKANECELGYKLVDGKCVINYSFKAEYEIHKDNEKMELTKSLKPEVILELIIDGENVKPTNNYVFQKKGTHTVYMLLDMDKIETLESMFSGLISFATVTFSELFNSDKFTSMVNMFRNCKSLREVDLSKFNSKNIKKMDFMFTGCTVLTSVDLSNFSNENLISMSRMFFHCSSLESLDLSQFKTPKVEDMSYTFADCSGLKKLDVSGFDTKNVKNMRGLFERCKSLPTVNIKHFDTENVTDMAYMFNKCYSLKEIDTSNLKGSKVTTIISMFYSCKALKSLDLSNFGGQSLTDLDNIFEGCISLEYIDFSNFAPQKTLKSINYLFFFCTSLTEVKLNNFKTEGVEKMNGVFEGCSKLKKIDVSGFDTSNVKTMVDMFNGCSEINELDISNFDFTNVEVGDLSRMFERCPNLTKGGIKINKQFIKKFERKIPEGIPVIEVN